MSPRLFPWATLAPQLPEQSRATAGSCTFPTFPSPSLLAGVWVSQRRGGWAVPRPLQPPPACTAGCARLTPAPGRAVPAAPGTSAGPGGGSSSLTQNLLHPPRPLPAMLTCSHVVAGVGLEPVWPNSGVRTSSKASSVLGGAHSSVSCGSQCQRVPRAPGDGTTSRAEALGAGLEVPGDSPEASCVG